jgi:uncharacterized protein (DUF1697 family)
MTKYAAFLRGVNVGGRIVKMADLKACLEKAGFSEVTTFLQSGNVIFESDKTDTSILKIQIQDLLTKTFNYPAKVQVISIPNLEKIINNYPFKIKDGFHDYIIFMESGLEKDLAGEAPRFDKNLEQVTAGKGVIYWQVERGQTLKSSFGKLLSKSKYKQFNTNRNLNTLRKMT